MTGTRGLRTSEPAMARTGIMRKKRPISMHSPSVVWYQLLVTVRPAKAEPLLFEAEANA